MPEKITELSGTVMRIMADDPVRHEELSRAIAIVALPNDILLTDPRAIPRHDNYGYLLDLPLSERCKFFLTEYAGHLRRKGGSDPERSAFNILTTEIEDFAKPGTTPGLYEVWEDVLNVFREEHSL